MGRPKKPAIQHKQEGTYQPCRHDGPALPVQIPDMPPDLEPIAQATWKRVTIQLERAGLIAELDAHSLRRMCELEATYTEARDQVRDRGITITNVNKNGSVTVINPAYRIMSDSAKQLVKLYTQFGMTPAARTGIKFTKSDDGSDEEKRVAGIIGIADAG